MTASSVLSTLYRTELRMLLRDRRTVVVSIVLPILVMPLMLFSTTFADRAREKRQESKVYNYAIVGPEADLARQLIASYEPDGDDDEVGRLQLAEVESADPEAAVDDQTLHFYIEALSPGMQPETAVGEMPAEEMPAEGSSEDTLEEEAEDLDEALTLPRLRLVFRANWDASETASSEMSRRLASVRRTDRYSELEALGFPVPVAQVAVVELSDFATASQVTGATLGRFAAAFVLLFLLTGGSVVAADAIAGEKERGTLETVLTTATRRRELVTSKLLVILTVGVVITVIQLLNLSVYVGLGVIEVPESFAVDLSPATVGLLLLLLLPLAALAGSVLLLASGYSKTYKEFQLYFFPVFVVMLAPSLASMLPGVQLRSVVALVPIANLSVAIREVLVGRFDLVFLGIAWVVSMAAAVAAGRATLSVLSTERLITASDIDRAEFEGGAALLPRHIWRWFLGMWVVLFLVATNIEQMQSLRPQIFFNLVGLFLGGSLLIVWRYRLRPAEAFALRPVKPVVWLAVILGAPGVHFAAIAVARLSGYLFPIPQRALEQFSQTLLPAEVPLWELLLLVAVLPGICEELAFRGVFLHALHRRFRPITLCLVVGVVFGLFHVDLFRLLPTASLGVLLSAVVLLTGSIYPAMVWHMLNNATGILAAHFEVSLVEMEAWVYGAGIAVGALAFVLLWKNRTPYPGLRPRRPRSSTRLD